MRRYKNIIWLVFLLGDSTDIYSQKSISNSVASIFNSSENIAGKPQYLSSPYTTAGDKLYMVGFQDGSFPDLGWHVKGEMGGIWSHPIKLVDGFEARVTINDSTVSLDKADAFVNYPFGNKHIYHSLPNGVSLERFQFVPDGKKAVHIGYAFKNKTDKRIRISLEMKVISNLRPVWLGERTGMVDGKDNSVFNAKNNYWTAKDNLNPWYVVFGSTIAGNPLNTNEIKPGKPNVSVTITEYGFEISPGAVFYFPFVIAGSSVSEEEAVRAFKEVSENV